MSYRSCLMIEQAYLNFNGRIDMGKKIVALCCEGMDGKPCVALTEPDETLIGFMNQRNGLILESKISGRLSGKFSSGCEKCPNYRMADWGSDGLIHYVNLSMYPSPCQCRCIYCNIHKEDQSIRSETAKAAYQKLFATLDRAQACGLIAADAIWQVSCGEIAIHPFRERILNYVAGKRTAFYTNCIKYDEDIAQNLHDNPASIINLSIDSGTPATWHKVKGLNNFETITENLAKYYAKSSQKGQITLKYIVLPDINDTYEDFASLMEIAKVLEVQHIEISRDTRIKYKMEPEYRTKMLGAAAYLLAMSHKNGISNGMPMYTPGEQNEAVGLANEILQRNLV